MKKYTNVSVLLSILLPVISFAAPLGGVKSLLDEATKIINSSVIPLMFGLAMAYFLWGLVQFISKSGDEKERESGKQKMLWGIIALFVFISITGILAFMGNSLGIAPGGLGGNGTVGGYCSGGVSTVDGSACN